MAQLFQQRCFNHAPREAAAKCLACGRFFCRECVTEHAGRLVCAACLRRKVPDRLTQRRWLVGLARALQFMLSLLTAWLLFFLIGKALLALPSAFHEGTLWTDHAPEHPPEARR